MPIQKRLPWGREVPSPRLLALDLDGTLLNSDWKLSERNLAALVDAHEAGIHIVIVTGRRYSAALELTEGITCPHYLVTNAGARIASSQKGVLESRTWKPALLEEFLEHLSPFKIHTFLITEDIGRGEIICSEPNMEDPNVAIYVSRNEAFLMKAADFRSDRIAPVLQVACSGTIERMELARKQVASFRNVGQLHVSRTVYKDRDLELVDIVSAGADKGSGLSNLAKRLGMGPDRIMALGDNYADTSMLEFAGYPIVMGNARAEMKQRWPVTGTNDENGVAQVIEGLIFS